MAVRWDRRAALARRRPRCRLYKSLHVPEIFFDPASHPTDRLNPFPHLVQSFLLVAAGGVIIAIGRHDRHLVDQGRLSNLLPHVPGRYGRAAFPFT